MQRIVRLLAVALVVGALALATALPAFAKGPTVPVADGGLGTAAFMLNEVGITDPDHPANDPTHNAACTITEKNPATTGDPTCS